MLHIFVYVCMYVLCMHVRMNEWMYVCMFVRTYAVMCVRMHLCVATYVCMYLWLRTHVYTYLFTYVRAFTKVCIINFCLLKTHILTCIC